MPLVVSLHQATPLHWELIHPETSYTFSTGIVHFTVYARVLDKIDYSKGTMALQIIGLSVAGVAGAATLGAGVAAATAAATAEGALAFGAASVFTGLVPGTALYAGLNDEQKAKVDLAAKHLKTFHPHLKEILAASLRDDHYSVSSAGWYANGKCLVVSGGPDVDENGRYCGSQLKIEYKDEYLQTITTKLREKSFKMQRYEERLHFLKRESQHDFGDTSRYRVVLLGVTGVGKSTIANRFCHDTSPRGNSGPFATSSRDDSKTERCQVEHVSWSTGNRTSSSIDLCIIDTPGLLDSKGRDEDFADGLITSLCGCAVVHAFILVFNVTNPRLNLAEKKALESLSRRFQSGVANYLYVFFNHVDDRNMELFNEKVVERQQALREYFGMGGIQCFPFAQNYEETILNFINTLRQDKYFSCDGLDSPFLQTQEAVNYMKAEIQHGERIIRVLESN